MHKNNRLGVVHVIKNSFRQFNPPSALHFPFLYLDVILVLWQKLETTSCCCWRRQASLLWRRGRQDAVDSESHGLGVVSAHAQLTRHPISAECRQGRPVDTHLSQALHQSINQSINQSKKIRLVWVAQGGSVNTSRVVSVLDSGAEGPGFKSQPRRCRVTVLGKLFTHIVPLFTKQRNW